MSDEPHPLGVALLALDAHGHKTCAEALAEYCSDLCDKVAAERQLREKASQALGNFVAQVDEFVAGKWDEIDWPAALGTLVDMAKDSRPILALARQTPAPSSGNGQSPEAGAKRRD